MTIEDLIEAHNDRIERLNRFLRLAQLSRHSKDSALERAVRRRLVGEIRQMLDYEQDALEADLEYRYSTTPGQRALDERAEPGCWENEDHFETDFAVVPLLQGEPLAGEDGRMMDTVTGDWLYVEEGYPKKITAEAEDIGELAVLIDTIQDDLGIAFTLDRYVWTEDALAIWVESEELRERRQGSRFG